MPSGGKNGVGTELTYEFGDGIKITTDYDQADAVAWATMATVFDALGRRDTVSVVYDDASRAFTDYDQAGASLVASVLDCYDALGRKDSETITYDDATRLVVDLDQDGSKTWSEARTHFDALGRLDDKAVVYDTGKSVDTRYDAADVHEWATLALTTDAAGHKDLLVQVNDDGSRVTDDVDLLDTTAWHEKITTTDAQSRVVDLYVQSDNGTATRTVYDPSGSEAYDRIDEKFDTAGTLVEQKVHNRDGSSTQTYWDATGSATWEIKQLTYDQSSQLVSTTTVGRDGTFAIAGISGFQLTFDPSLTSAVFRDNDGQFHTLDLTSDDDDPNIELARSLVGPGGPKGAASDALWAIVVSGLAALGKLVYDVHGSLTMPTPPPGVDPSSSRFIFGTEDGTNWYVDATGQTWAYSPLFGLMLGKQLPTTHGTVIGTDVAGTCQWIWLNNRSGSDDAKAYSQQITGVPFGLECVASDSTTFDGFNYPRDTFLEAKGPGYAKWYDDDGNALLAIDSGTKPWFGDAQWKQEMDRQVAAADGKKIEWHVAEEGFRKAVQKYIDARGYISVSVVHTPKR